jgi:glycosyltransferase involved in cell wall biosynthesis
VPLYFDPYDVEDMAEKLERLITMPEADRLELGQRGSKHAERYHRDSVKLIWERFIDDVLAGKYAPKDR